MPHPHANSPRQAGAQLLNLDGSTNITALLGPTNTGKTWAAIERMLQHRSGMMGLPLRLLAREVYDRVTARVGERAVALVTGEEKRIPTEPRYWICTVESMPVDRPVGFVAVDEIQLCAHRERGHVFTDRLLHARGAFETMLLGSDTMEPLVRRLIPTAKIQRNQRFSKLSYTPPQKLVSLPPRTAVVAFSAADVYAMAERLKARHGGTAVVLGALSPRTRNAQVAMYEAGEVPYMVATDAIGMGLNMDLDLVAFAALRKFDGFEARDLLAAEIGQIAGRAGRYKRDGRFCALSEVGPLDDALVAAVEGHLYPPVSWIYWRNTDLDFTSVDALLSSLDRPSPAPFLVPTRDADDRQVLDVLAGMDEVRSCARGKERVSLLWEVCQIPDYRKSLAHSHGQLVLRLYQQLTSKTGRIDPSWLASRVDRLDRVDGDIETLLSRIAWIRTWTYVSFRGDWIQDAPGWQARTRDIEDRLSDALHERLQRRFVDHRAVVLMGGMNPQANLEPKVSPDGSIRVGGVDVGFLEGFQFQAAGFKTEGHKHLERAVHALLGPELEARVQRLVEAPHEAFELDPRARILWDGACVGQLVAGEDAREPRIRLARADLLGAGARSRVERRLSAWAKDLVAASLAPLRNAATRDLGPAGKGLVYLLERGMGVVSCGDARENLRRLTEADRRALARMDVRLGASWVYVASLLAPGAGRLRGILQAVYAGVDPETLPVLGVSGTLHEGIAPAICLAMGYARVGGIAVRVDALETLAARARGLARKGGRFPLGSLAEGIGATEDQAVRVLEDLGFRVRRTDGGVRIEGR